MVITDRALHLSYPRHLSVLKSDDSKRHDCFDKLMLRDNL